MAAGSSVPASCVVTASGFGSLVVVGFAVSAPSVVEASGSGSPVAVGFVVSAPGSSVTAGSDVSGPGCSEVIAGSVEAAPESSVVVACVLEGSEAIVVEFAPQPGPRDKPITDPKPGKCTGWQEPTGLAGSVISGSGKPVEAVVA
jgi:hypothetical protein